MAAGGQYSVGYSVPDRLSPDATGQPSPRCSSSQILMARPSPICYPNIPTFSNSFFFFCLSAASLPLLGPWVSSDLCAWLSLSMGSPHDGKGMDGVFVRYRDGLLCHWSGDRQRKHKQQSSRPLLHPDPHTILICLLITPTMGHKHHSLQREGSQQLMLTGHRIIFGGK